MSESYFKRIKNPVSSPEEAKPILKETKTYLFISIGVCLFASIVESFSSKPISTVLSFVSLLAAFAAIYFGIMLYGASRAVERIENLICEKCGSNLGDLEHTTYEELSQRWSDSGANKSKLYVKVRFRCECANCGTVKSFTEELGAGEVSTSESKTISTSKLVEDYLNGMIHAYLKWDCSIKEKMEIKERLLRKVLESVGITTAEINKLIVFTDNKIQVQNRCASLKTCFANQLVYLIDEVYGSNHYTISEMRRMKEAIEQANHKEAYMTDLNVTQIKQDFASVLALLEEAKKEKERKEQEQDRERNIDDLVKSQNDKSFWGFIKKLVNTKGVKAAGATTAVAFVIGAAAIIKNR